MGYYDPPEYYESEIDYECENPTGLTYDGYVPVICDFSGKVTVYSSSKYGEDYEGECPQCGYAFDGSTTPDDYDGLSPHDD